MNKKNRGRPKQVLVNSFPVGDILIAIFAGHKTIGKIAKALDKKHPTIIEQIKPLVEQGWLEKEETIFRINKPKFIDYYYRELGLSKTYSKMKFDMLLDIFAASGQKITINFFGSFIQLKINLEPLMIKTVKEAMPIIKKVNKKHKKT